MNLFVLWLTSIKADFGSIFEGEQVSLPGETNSVQMPETIPQDHDSSQTQPRLSRESHFTQESRHQNRSDIENAITPLDDHSHRNEVEVRTTFRTSFALMH